MWDDCRLQVSFTVFFIIWGFSKRLKRQGQPWIEKEKNRCNNSLSGNPMAASYLITNNKINFGTIR